MNINKNTSENIEKVFYNKVGTVYTEIDPASISNGLIWSNKANLNTGRSSLAGCGESNNALSFGGYVNSTAQAITELFDSISWVSRANLNQNLYGLAGCGISNNALTMGGVHGQVASNQIFNGITWNTLSTGVSAFNTACCGVSNSALVYGAMDGAVTVAFTKLFNGTSYINKSSMNGGRQNHSGCGVSNNALVIGGYMAQSNTTFSSVELYNGSSWSARNSLNSTRTALASCGVFNNALVFGGVITYNSSNYIATTESYNGSVWSNKTNVSTSRYSLAGCGASTNALSFGGYNGSYLATTEQYVQSSYTPDLPNWPDTSIIGKLLSSEELTIS